MGELENSPSWFGETGDAVTLAGDAGVAVGTAGPVEPQSLTVIGGSGTG